jgi:hypothetical protein
MSVSLILRPSYLTSDKPWALQLRWHDLSGTDYQTIARVNDETAMNIIAAGRAYWLSAEPDWAARAKEQEIVRLRERLAELEGTPAPAPADMGDSDAG